VTGVQTCALPISDAVTRHAECDLYCRWVLTSIEAENVRLTPGIESDICARCPGFLNSRRRSFLQRWRGPMIFSYYLQRWFERRQFADAEKQCWIDALRIHAAIQPAVIRADAFWLKQHRCLRRKAAQPGAPTRALSYADWRAAIDQISELGTLDPELPLGRAYTLVKGIDRATVQLAMKRYVEHAIFLYWVAAIERAAGTIPPFLQEAIRRRWPSSDLPAHTAEDAQSEIPLLYWVEQTLFPDAVAGGWLDAVRIFAEEDIHYQRGVACSLKYEEQWIQSAPAEYPGFEGWLADVDAYTEYSEPRRIKPW